MVWTPDPPGPPIVIVDERKDTERFAKQVTWVEEDGTQLLRSGHRVLGHRKLCITSRTVVVVHRNLEVSAL